MAKNIENILEYGTPLKGKQKEIRKIKINLLKIYKYILNEKLKVRKMSRYWNILIIRIISEVVEVVSDRYQRVCNEDVEIIVEDIKWKKIKIKSRREFIRKSESSKLFNEWIVKSISKNTGRETDKVKKESKSIRETIEEKLFELKRVYLKSRRDMAVSRKSSGESEENLSKINMKKSSVKIFCEKTNVDEGSAKEICRLVESSKIGYNEIESRRLKGREKSEPGGLLKVCKKIVDEIIKGEILSWYKDMKKIGNNEDFPKVIVDSFIGDDIEQKIFVAESVENGSTLVCAQHGGWYGEFKYYGNEWCEREISDVFASWGHERFTKDKKLPSLKYIRWKESEVKSGGEKLIWLSKSIDSWGEYVYPSTMYKCEDRRYDGKMKLNRSKVLSSKLNRHVRENAILRFDYKVLPDTSEFASQLRRRIARELDPVQIDAGGVGLEDRVRDAALALVDHVPSTVFAECVHMGVPTLLYDRVNWEALTDNACEAYRALGDAGVLYQDASEAAAKINEIYPDPLVWWQSDDVQEAVHHYIDQFAYVGEEPIEEWVSFLEELPIRKSQ